MKRTFINIMVFCLMGISTFLIQAQENQFSKVDFTTAAENSVHCVVHIQCDYSVQTNTMMDFFDLFMNPFNSMQPRQRTLQTSGSGVIMSADGYIITNNHVVADADKINVILNDRRTFQAKLIGNDPSADLAVIKIEADSLHFISFANSDDVKIGEWVLAVGNPFNLTSTVTAGIVSAKARDINILGNKMSQNPITSFIQTDAAVNPGNSGGALVNLQGELIGINTAIASSTGSYTGYSFAIPSNIVRKVTNDLVKYGMTQKAYLGVNLMEVDANLAANKGLKSIHGIYLADVLKGGAAEKAGLKDGDIITKINGKNVNTNSEYNEIMAQFSPNQQIEIEYERKNNLFTQTLTLLNSSGTTEVIDNTSSIMAAGVSFRELSIEERQRYNLDKGVGFEVLNTGRSSFARVGIKKGLIITLIDNEPATIKTIQNLNKKQGQQVIIEGFYSNGQRNYYMLIL
ncbi:MAG: trypsin-like peptidase domain-containing protein [Bacteroidales bacterium]|jgi:Do/DeqQ family serine protease|nr:trypsin-like peptidase domain-containing protein [Bacteroidales bacterium]